MFTNSYHVAAAASSSLFSPPTSRVYIAVEDLAALFFEPTLYTLVGTRCIYSSFVVIKRRVAGFEGITKLRSYTLTYYLTRRRYFNLRDGTPRFERYFFFLLTRYDSIPLAYLFFKFFDLDREKFKKNYSS